MKVVPLGAIAAPKTARAGQQADLPVYSVTKHAGFMPSLEYFKKQVFSREVADYKVVEQGEFAYATIHLDEGSVGIAPERALISPMYTVFSVDESQVDRNYLIRYLKSPRALSRYPQLGKGAIHRRKAITFESVAKLDIPLPALGEQRRIAAILDAADAIRSRRRAVLRYFDTLAQGLYEHSFREGARLARVGDVMTNLRNGISPASGGAYVADVLTLSAVTQGAFDPRAVKAGSFAVEPPLDKRVNSGDFLMCRGNGNRNLVGAGAYSTADRPDLVFPDTVIAGRVDQNQIVMPYLNACWKSQKVRRQIEAAARTTNGTFKVNQQSVAAIKIPIPPLADQQAFAVRVARIDAQRAAVQRALAADDELFASLQSRAFSGKL